MPSVDNNNNEKTTLKDALVKNGSPRYKDVLINVPNDPEKGPSFQVDESFRTPTHVAGAQDKYMNPINIEKGNMDYLAAFAQDSIKKMQIVSKLIDPNNERGVVQPNINRDTGELTGTSNNKLSGSVSVKGADGEEYRLSVQQRNIQEPKPYSPSKTERELFGDMGNPDKPSKVKVFGTQISIAKKDKETGLYGKELGSVMLWGQSDPVTGRLVPKETERNGAVINNYFTLATDQNKDSFRMISQVIKDGFSYTPQQLVAEKENPELAPKVGNMSFRLMDKDVVEKVKDSFVKTAEAVTKDTSREMPNKNLEGKETGKTLFVSTSLDTAPTGVDERGRKINKTAVIITPAVWTSKEHDLDYSKHVAKVEPNYGKENVKEFGANMNKAVAEYNKAHSKEAPAKTISNEKTQTKTKTKGKDRDIL